MRDDWLRSAVLVIVAPVLLGWAAFEAATPIITRPAAVYMANLHHSAHGPLRSSAHGSALQADLRHLRLDCRVDRQRLPKMLLG